MPQEQADGEAPIRDQLLTVRQTMNVLHVSRTTLYHLIERGKLHPLHIGRALRFPAEEVRLYLRRLIEQARGR